MRAPRARTGSRAALAAPRLSIVIPALNEAPAVRRVLAGLQPLRGRGHEVVLVDGGSGDDTRRLAAPLVDRLIEAPRGRARQMNAGAAIARGEVVLFLHADTELPPDADAAIAAGLESSGAVWGRFDVRLSGRHPLLRVVERLMSLRSRLSAIATGDQAIFVRRECFRAAGGFPELSLMEDVALSRTLKGFTRPLCLRARVTTASRRWDEHGVVRTIVLMWWLRLAYALGADPQRLARAYERGVHGRNALGEGSRQGMR